MGGGGRPPRSPASGEREQCNGVDATQLHRAHRRHTINSGEVTNSLTSLTPRLDPTPSVQQQRETTDAPSVPLRPGRIPGSPVFSVYRYRKHGVCVRFELYEKRLGCHLVATLKKGPNVVYELTEWRSNQPLGWLCANLKGDRFTLYEHADIGGPAKEAVATMALGWKLTEDNTRRVDAVRLEPSAYRVQAQPAPRCASAPPQCTIQQPASALLRRRQQRSLSVSVPEDQVAAISKREHSPAGSPSNASPTSLAMRRNMKSLRLDLSSVKDPGLGEPVQEPNPLRTPLLGDAEQRSEESRLSSLGRPSYHLVEGTDDIQAFVSAFPEEGTPEKEAAAKRPPSPIAKAFSSLRASVLQRSGSSQYLPLEGGPDAAEISSPVSVLQALGSPGPSPFSPPPRLPPSPGSSLTLSNGLGGRDMLALLEALIEQGAAEVELPKGALAMRSAQPTWNEALGSHSLDFGGLVHQRSVKNTVLLAFGEGGAEAAHPTPRPRGSMRRASTTGHGLSETLLSPDELTYSNDVGHRVLVFGRHNASDGSEFVVSYAPGKLSKVQAFSVALATCLKKAVFTYI